MRLIKPLAFSLALLLARFAIAQTLPAAVPNRWTLDPYGGISWDIAQDKNLPHEDHIEMSGQLSSLILTYGVDKDGHLTLSRHLVIPTLRTIPNNTRGNLSHDWGIDAMPTITVDGQPLGPEKPFYMNLDAGVLTIVSHTDQSIDVTRRIFPPRHARAAIEVWTLSNRSNNPHNIVVQPWLKTEFARGTTGIYVLEAVDSSAAAAMQRNDNGTYDIPPSKEPPAPISQKPGGLLTFSVTFSGRRILENYEHLNFFNELAARYDFAQSIRNSLILETPDHVLNTEFDFAKLRAAESIFETKAGLLHSPGGGSYYAAVWANDQVEYAGPFFPFLGNADANTASLNAYNLYIPFMGPKYEKIPSSIIAEGLDIWEGAKDRGDAAMYCYGASRFALARGDKPIAEHLYPAIQWCLEYCRRQLTPDGVVFSNTDELEGRFPTNNKPNLSTSTLYYGGLRSAADLARSLGKDADAKNYDTEADALGVAINKVFAAKVEGFDTYQYFDGNPHLRSWICLPLTMGIMDRKEGTIAALFSPQLWTIDGVATQAGDKTFWDRSTLYSFRGALNAGETERVLPYVEAYTRRRLLGDHVPYPVEAYPEGEQRHLSAESALFCRVITEGFFGIKPTGLNSFTLTPRLPKAWPSMKLAAIHAFNTAFDITISRDGEKLHVSVKTEKSDIEQNIADGETMNVTLP